MTAESGSPAHGVGRRCQFDLGDTLTALIVNRLEHPAVDLTALAQPLNLPVGLRLAQVPQQLCAVGAVSSKATEVGQMPFCVRMWHSTELQGGRVAQPAGTEGFGEFLGSGKWGDFVWRVTLTGLPVSTIYALPDKVRRLDA